MSTTIAWQGSAAPVTAKSGVRRWKLLGATAAAVLVLPFTAGTASAATQAIRGGYATVTATNAHVCANQNLNMHLFYARLKNGSESGGMLSARPGRCSQLTLLDGSRFTHFHLCNSYLECGEERYV